MGKARGRVRGRREMGNRQGTAAWPSCPGQAHAGLLLSPTLSLACLTCRPSFPSAAPTVPLYHIPFHSPFGWGLFFFSVLVPARPMPASHLRAPLFLRPRAHLSSLRHLSSLYPNVYFHLLWIVCTSAAGQTVFILPLNPERCQRLSGEGARRILLREPLLSHHPKILSPLNMGSWAVTPGGEVPGPSQ